MKEQAIAGLRLFYAPEEQAAAVIIAEACERSVALIRGRWGLPVPKDCRVFVMTSWFDFLMQSSPWYWKPLLIQTMPWTARRARAIWPYSGGWTVSFGKRRAVGIKPPRLIQSGNRSIGDSVFTRDRDLTEIVQTITCHELVHAFTGHLRLPAWLHEGLATLAMEDYLGRRIVRNDTLASLTGAPYTGRPNDRMAAGQPQQLVVQFARGYWLTRYIDETRPDLLRTLLAERCRRDDLDEMLAAAYGKNRQAFWQQIDGEVIAYFQERSKDQV